MSALWRTRRISVGTKFGLIVALCTCLIMVASIALVAQRLGAEDARHSEDVARTTAGQIGAAVQNVFEDAFDIVATTHDSLIALKDAGITDPHVYDTILERMIVSGTDRYGAWLVWDGADAPLDDAPASRARRDGKGRFATYWHQNGMEMLRDVLPPEIYESALYRVPYVNDKAYLLEPHDIDAVHGDSTLVTSFSKPLEHDGKVVGALAVDLKLDAIADALSSIVLPAGASITVVSDGGVVAMSTAKGWAGRPLTAASPPLARLFETAKRGDGSRLGRDPGGETEFLTSWNAVRFAGVTNPWYLLMKVPERSLLATSSSDRIFFLLVSVVALLAILAVVLVAMNKLVARPLKTLSTIIGELGEGLFDFVVPGRARMDEVGDIARAVERLQESGLEIARLHEAKGEGEYRRQLARRHELDDISTRFSRSIEAMVSALGEVASTVESNSREVSTTTQTAVRRLGSVSDASSAARTSMASVATATSSLLATIAEIGDQTRQSKSAAEKVERHTASTDLSIATLKRTIDDIDSVATLIREVAAQINLISLNATIEAARAGEAGRGFAVVAQEIKTLAMRTAKATEEIGRHIAAVQNASGAADGNITEMKDAFVEMRLISVGIAGALDVQLGATDKIGSLVKEALGGADSVAAHMLEIVQSAHQVHGAADVMLAQSGSLGAEISGLSAEVANFLRFLKAA